MRILLIEDDIRLCSGIIFHLKQENYNVDTCHDGLESIYFIEHNVYDLIILDRLLPSLDGISILKHIRSQNITTPVLMVTALSDIDDRVDGLDAGADDYLAKPFAIKELLARIRALSRRPTALETLTSINYEDVNLDLSSCVLQGPTHSCSLSKREATLTEFFLKNPNRILPRNLILSKVWGPDALVEDGNLDNYIHFLRRRLNTVGSTLRIKTVRGIGYSLEVNNAE